MPAAADTVRSFRCLRALVLGDAILDTYLEGSAARLCSEGPVPVVQQTAQEQAPGGAANTAANLRALGADVTYLGLIGRDTPGMLLRSTLRQRHVDDRSLIEDPAVTTLHKMRILANDQYVVRFDSGDTHSPSPDARKQILQSLEDVLPRCDLIVVSDYAYGAVSEEIIARLCTLRASHPCVLVIDAKDLSRFRHIDATAITPNHLEAQLAVRGSTSARAGKGCTLNGDGGLEELRAVGYELLEIIDCEIVAITLAADGVLLLNRNGGSTHLPAHPVTHANVAGAGDSFTAAFALGLAARTHPLEAARIALAAAGIAVAKRRTAVVHLQELLQRVSLESPAPEGRHEALPLLAARLEAERRRGRSIVFTNGVFDILHAGHVDFLRRARQLGDILVVGVNSDRSARRLKGKNRPINSERDRAALVAALDPVDYVITFDETTPSETIRALRPDIHAKGGDYAGETLPEEEAVREAGGRVVILPLLGDVSTSGVIERIAAVSQPPVGARR